LDSKSVLLMNDTDFRPLDTSDVCWDAPLITNFLVQSDVDDVRIVRLQICHPLNSNG
jgi:hypothetical protein